MPPKVKRKWMRPFEEMMALNSVQFKCCLKPPNAIGNPSLVDFCDASRRALGPCAYTKLSLNDGNFGVRFVDAKSGVTPLKELSSFGVTRHRDWKPPRKYYS